MGLTCSVLEAVAGGLGRTGRALADTTRIFSQPGRTGMPQADQRLALLQRQLDAGGGWDLQQRILGLLARSGLDPDASFAGLSAGAKRRALFAGTLALQADILLLDEPTNHLDIDAIVWMEEFILRHVKTLLVVTHDRAFLKRVANRVLELDRGRLRDSYAVLEKLGLARFVNELACNLPYGAQRRLEIARALATGPFLLLLDEPAAGMNPNETRELVNLIVAIRNQENVSILLIEHDMKLVMSLSDRIFVVDYGKKIAQGSPREIKNNPVVIKAYLGEEFDA